MISSGYEGGSERAEQPQIDFRKFADANQITSSCLSIDTFCVLLIIKKNWFRD